MSIQHFRGFHGFAMAVQIDGAQYFILAETEAELEALHRTLIPDREFDPCACRDAILINAELLPDHQP